VFLGLNGSQEGEGHDRSAIDLPEPFTDYSMKNRTYRYFKGEPP